MAKGKYGFIGAVPEDTEALSGVFNLDEQKNLQDLGEWETKVTVTCLSIGGGAGGAGATGSGGGAGGYREGSVTLKTG